MRHCLIFKPHNEHDFQQNITYLGAMARGGKFKMEATVVAKFNGQLHTITGCAVRLIQSRPYMVGIATSMGEERVRLSDVAQIGVRFPR